MMFVGYNNVAREADFSGRTSGSSALSIVDERTLSVPLSMLSTSSDKSWRQTNRLVVEYRSEIAARLTKLVSQHAVGDDPEVVKLAADVIDHVPLTASIGIKRSREIVKTPQAESVEKITNRKVHKYILK